MAAGTAEMGPDTVKVASWTVANWSKPRLSRAGPVGAGSDRSFHPTAPNKSRPHRCLTASGTASDAPAFGLNLPLMVWSGAGKATVQGQMTETSPLHRGVPEVPREGILCRDRARTLGLTAPTGSEVHLGPPKSLLDP